MKKRHFCKVLSLVLALVLAGSMLAGCSGGSSGAGSTAGGAAGGGGDAAGTPAAKDSLNVVTYNDITGVFPLAVDYGADKTRDAAFFQNVYDTLFRLDEGGNPSPWLATDYEVSEDGLEWTFTLRDDVYFHNGEKMTAADVVFSWETALAENPASATSMLNGLAAGEVIDDTHCKAILSHVSPAFLNMLCTQMGVIICKSYFEEVGVEGYAANPIGTGAYRFVSRTSGEKIVLEANEEYWAGAPAIKNVELTTISNVSTQFISLESGDADVVINADLASCTRLAENSIATWTYADSTTRTLIAFGWTNGAYIRDDLNLRLAIQSAIRKEDLLAGVLFGYGKILDIDVVTGFPTSPEEGTYTVIPYDQEAAKGYLAASDYDGRELSIYVVSGSSCEKAAQIVQGQLAEVGINAAVVPCDTATFNTASRTASQGDMFLYDNTNVWFDFCNPGASYNPDMENSFKPEEYFSGYQTLKDLYAKIAVEQDPKARKQLMADLMSYGVENAYQIPLYASVRAVAYNKDLKGVTASPVGDFYIANLSW